MLIEAVVLFAEFTFLGGGPRGAAGVDLTTAEHADASDEGHTGHGDGHDGAAKKADKKKTLEINIVDSRAQNMQNGRMVLYDVSIFAVTKDDFEEKVKGVIKDREALIKDRVRTIMPRAIRKSLRAAPNLGSRRYVGR